MKSYLKYSILLALFLGAWSLHADTIADLKADLRKALRYSFRRFPNEEQAHRILADIEGATDVDALQEELRNINDYFGLGINPQDYEGNSKDLASETLYRIQALLLDDRYWVKTDSLLVTALSQHLAVFMKLCKDHELNDFHRMLEDEERVHLPDLVRLNDTLLLLRKFAQKSNLLDDAVSAISDDFVELYLHFGRQRDSLHHVFFQDGWIDNRLIGRVKLIEALLEQARAVHEDLVREVTQATPPAAAAAAAAPVVMQPVTPVAVPTPRRSIFSSLLDGSF